MQEANILFTIHFICYWFMVILYDIDSLIILSNSVKNSLKNQILCTLPMCHLFFYNYTIEYNNFQSILGLLVLIITGDIYFYISHRPMHTKLLWKFHKTHHQGNICVSKSLDADLFEHLVGNLGSFAVGILLFQYYGFIFNIYVLYLWSAITTISVCISHSNSKCYLDNNVHLLHHKLLKYNFGTGFYIIDRVCNSHKS